MFGTLRFISKYLCFEIGGSVWEVKNVKPYSSIKRPDHNVRCHSCDYTWRWEDD